MSSSECEKRNVSFETTVKISPTYQSTDLMAPLRVPPADTVASKYIITDGIRSWNSCPNPSWSTHIDDYGGIGGLSYLAKKRERREDILVPRSHRHFLSSPAKMIHDKVQPKNITPFIKSKLRQHDEMITDTNKPKQYDLMKEENQLKKEVPQFCFISKNALFPKSELEYEKGRRHKYLNKRTLEELEKLIKGRNYSSYQLDFPLPPTTPSKSKQQLIHQQFSTNKEKATVSPKALPSENIIKGLWPCWPAGGTHLISNLTGQIVEKRDVVSLDDKRDCRIQNQSGSAKDAMESAKLPISMKLSRPKTPRRILSRPKSPYFKHKNYIDRINKLVEETARRKHIELDSDKTQWTWYTGQNLGFLQQADEKEHDEDVEMDSDDEVEMDSVLDGGCEANKDSEVMSLKSSSHHAIESFLEKAKVQFQNSSDQLSKEKLPRMPRTTDPFSISLELDSAVGTITDLYNSVSARQVKAQHEMKGYKPFKFKSMYLPNLTDQNNEPTMNFEDEIDPIEINERLGPHFKSTVVRKHQQQHSCLVPDLRDFRPTIRKSHWLGHHTSVFR